jgi:hypothetical protein
MGRKFDATLQSSAQRVLAALTAAEGGGAASRPEARSLAAGDLAALLSAELVAVGRDGRLTLTASGRAHQARAAAERAGGPIDKFRAQHPGLAARTVGTAEGEQTVMTVNDAESPLVWLARRKGRNGRSYVQPAHLQAGERLRIDFTRAQMMPRTTSNWTAAVAQGPRGSMPASYSDVIIAARQRVRHALDAAGPEFAGLLVDVCCFLKRLEDVERERTWPPRSAKVVLQLGLDRLARHYGLGDEARGPARAPTRTWLAPDVAFTADGGECGA